uniref:Fucosyl-beta-1,4-N-acetylglucosamine oligosaccharide 2-O-methyltransferase NoeI n=1 Tax=Candidatus Kentrum sp. FW TaxID=2126338 RepID=A0A450TCP8_9GAMM|nr:MAG: fucosyl-beta-1,4-N-acetylglucosamine oligosaccharide 2-O-methyltransferase NoeI [Candidatus Kentron sp. FW]
MNILRKVLTHSTFINNLSKPLYSAIQGKITEDLVRECVGRSDPTILEIGCNDGTDTLWFLEIFENPKIYCFEPDPRAIARFKEKVGQHPNINLFEIALSDHDGSVVFYQSDGQLNERAMEDMPEGWDLSGSIKRPKEHLKVHPWINFDKKIMVKTETLDAWCNKQGIDVIDFIWMDVQGAETDVFKGGVNTLAKTRFLYTEYSDTELYDGQRTLKQLLQHLDYFKVLVRYSGDVLLKNKNG